MRGLAPEALNGHAPAASGVVDFGGWVAPAMELIYEQGTPAFRGQWPGIEAMLGLATLRAGHGDWPHPSLELPAVGPRLTRHDAWRLAGAGVAGALEPPVAAGVLHDNPAGRVAALARRRRRASADQPGPIARRLPAPAVHPRRRRVRLLQPLRGRLLPRASAPPRRGAPAARQRAALVRPGGRPSSRGEPSVRAVSLCLAVRIAPDDRQFDPLWEALQDADLPLLHRPSFCARVWSPGRLLAYLHGSGVLDRYPGLRVGSCPGSPSARPRISRATIDPGGPARRGHRIAAVRGRERHTARGGLRRSERGMLWASDFPLRGSLRPELARAGVLGAAADRRPGDGAPPVPRRDGAASGGLVTGRPAPLDGGCRGAPSANIAPPRTPTRACSSPWSASSCSWTRCCSP